MKNISIFVALFAAMVFASCNKNEVVVIRLDETELELIKGETRQLKATVVPADASASVEWFSSMPEYVSVSETGLVKAEKIYYKNETDTEGTPVSIYCKYNGGAAECEVMVLPLDVKSVSLKVMDQDESLRLDPQQTKMLIVEYEPADADIDYSKLEWSTSDFKYVSVKPVSGTATAKITANWAGSADITVRYSNLEDVIGVIVTGIEATSVTIADKDRNTVVEGYTLQLGGSFLPANATVELVWNIVQGSEFAKINTETGLLTAIKPGTVKVKVAAGKVYDFIDITILEDTSKN